MMIMLAVSALTAVAGNPSAAYIQRTMKTLEASTEANPAHVRVLFYGQSITAQSWTDIVQKDLKARYPTVDFEFRKAAIGGYTSNLLIRTADHDLYPWYPDLLFFHVYGPVDKYAEIVASTRERTSAEIVLWTSHINNPKDLVAGAAKAPADARAEAIRGVAETNSCMLIDLREKWHTYLQENHLSVTNLLRDGIHLNPQGCDLYGSYIKEEIVRIPGANGDPGTSGTITAIAANSPDVKRGADGSLALKFTGNRVVAVADGTGTKGTTVKVLLDGKPLDDVKDVWAITRPSVGPAGIWMPAVNNIGFEQPLLEEEWTLTCLPDSTPDGKKIHFKVEGSQTGADGEGWSTERFVSKSGRVIIEPADWRIEWTLGYKKSTLPDGFKVTWKSYPMFASVCDTESAGSRTLLVQGCANQPHTLTLIPSGGKLGISEFVVHAPPSSKK